MPLSFPPAWLGVDFEAHGLAIGLASTLSFAIRWHGDRPAVLWEVHGAPMPLVARHLVHRPALRRGVVAAGHGRLRRPTRLVQSERLRLEDCGVSDA